jgi:hypothetical protein
VLQNRSKSPSGFGSNAKSFTIGTKPKERHNDSPGPGHYVADVNLTKYKVPEVRLDKGPERPDNFTKVQDYKAECGIYQKIEPFGAKAKGFTISNSPTRQSKSQTRNYVGPGSYDVAKSMTYLKPRPPVIDFSAYEHRSMTRKSQHPDQNENPNYSPKPFASDAKSFKIETRRKEKVNDVPGPGRYSPEMTHLVHNPTFKMDSGTRRPDNFTKKLDYHAEVGLYNTSTDFGSNAKSFKIVENKPFHRRQQTEVHVGPGTYNVQKSTLLPKTPSVTFGSRVMKENSRSPVRKPSYSTTHEFTAKPFGSDTKSFKIGERSQERVSNVPGPGQYDFTRADSQTKVKIPSTRLDIGGSRPDHFVKKDRPYAELGTYNVQP